MSTKNVKTISSPHIVELDDFSPPSDDTNLYTISQHAKERYSERIMQRENKGDVAKFVSEHDEKIKKDINKMIQYGTLIYDGPQMDGRVAQVYIKDAWVVIADAPKKIVITLFKIDLGLDEAFNIDYVKRMVEKFSDAKKAMREEKEKIEKEAATYNDIVEENNRTIEEYRRAIKALEDQNDGYKKVIKGLNAGLIKLSNDVKTILNKLIGKRTF